MTLRRSTPSTRTRNRAGRAAVEAAGAGGARRVLERIAESRKPYIVCFVGLEEAEVPANACWAPT